MISNDLELKIEKLKLEIKASSDLGRKLVKCVDDLSAQLKDAERCIFKVQATMDVKTYNYLDTIIQKHLTDYETKYQEGVKNV